MTPSQVIALIKGTDPVRRYGWTVVLPASSINLDPGYTVAVDGDLLVFSKGRDSRLSVMCNDVCAIHWEAESLPHQENIHVE